MRVFAALMFILASSTLAAEPLNIARLFADPSLSGTAPRSLKVAPDGTRVTFLRGRADAQDTLDLWEYVVASRETRMLVDSRLLAPAGEKLSAAEAARRERARTAQLSGIVEYDFSPDGSALLFPLNGELYLYDLAKSGKNAVRTLTHGGGFATDPKVSPRGAYVSFVRDQNLWIVDLRDGREIRVTHDGGRTVANATAEFVAQEEMDRHTGYWWAPDDARIAYTRYDESRVPIQRRFEIHADRAEVIEQRYPAAGQPNVEISLRVVRLADIRKGTSAPAEHEMSTGDSVAIDPKMGHTVISRILDLGEDPDIYLARVDWVDAERLSFQRQSRDQRTLDLILVDLPARTQRTLLSERSETWINLHDDLRFLKSGDGFVWASEREGTKQLYRYGLDGKLRHRITGTPWPLDKLLAFDEARSLVYVAAPGPDALQKQVYAYRLDGEGEPRKLTQEEGWHEAEFSRDARVFVATHSDPAIPPRVRLFDAQGAMLATLEANALAAEHAYAPYRAAHRTPVYGTLRADDGQTLHYGYVTPPDFDPAKRYPVLLRYYGGPGRQFVNKSWTSLFNTGLTDLLTQYWAQSGYVVFALDNRGTPRRGKRFEEAIHRRMGEAEVRDQVVGLDWLGAQAWVDTKRIGGFGWSYGGYQTLMLLAKAPGRLAAGVAGAPVTEWRLYDTHYTERYLDHPEVNAAGYDASGVMAQLDALKSPLLLLHGMADDNVLFTHSTRLMAGLQERAVLFDLMTYPGKHALVGPATRIHMYSTIDSFLARHLQP